MTANIRKEREKIISKLDAKNLREKVLNGEIIQTLNAQGELNSLPRDMAKLDFCADVTASQVSIQTKKTKVLE